MRVCILIAALIFVMEFQGAACDSKNSRNSPGANQPTASANLNVASEKNMNNQNQNKNQQAADETWGGDHIRITLRADGADVEFDCAHGEISKALKTDADGNFDLPGTFVQEGGGPTRSDRVPASRSVNYRGRIQDGSMTLSITFSDTNESAGSFTLSRGKHGRIRKCL